jgi:hypothetical protein
MARKTISKKLRFEVFKRDSFKCQYCGRVAPDVILNVDHIDPVASEGSNDILNLITSCFDCNAGKSDRKLSDDSAMVKQRDQLESLQERREQLEMMIEWKKGLDDLDDEAVDKLLDYWKSLAPGWSLKQEFRGKFSKLIRKFGVKAIMDAMRIAADQYVVFDGKTATCDSWGIAWGKISGICRVTKDSEDKPYLRDLYYIRGIIRNRFSYVNDHEAMKLMEEAVGLGVSVDQLKQHAKTADHWTNFRTVLENTIEDRKEKRK